MDKYQKFRRHIRFCFSASIGGIFYVIKYCADPACWNVYELDLSGLKKIGRSAVIAPVGSGNGVENKLAVLVSDTVAVLVQLIHPALL